MHVVQVIYVVYVVYVKDFVFEHAVAAVLPQHSTMGYIVIEVQIEREYIGISFRNK